MQVCKAIKIILPSAAILMTLTITSAGPESGSISGKVTFEGTPAKQHTIDMSQEPSCAKQHTTPATTESVVTGPNNTLETLSSMYRPGRRTNPPPSSRPSLRRRVAATRRT